MDYEQVRAVFFAAQPEGVDEPAAVRAGSPARRLRDALEPIAMHAVWCERTNAALADLGLDFLQGYVMGRASALGEPAPGVVAAAFAVFEPGFVRGLYETARTGLSRTDLLLTRDKATIISLRGLLGGADVAPVAAVLRRGLDAAEAVGRPLFAGLADRPWPGDPYGQLWRACDLLREHRGDSHVAACVAAGLDAVEMNILTELWLEMPLFSYTASRAWSPDAMQAAADRLRARGLLDGDALSAAGRNVREAIEARTDRAQQPILQAIGADLDGVVQQLNQWSAVLVDGGAFPPDPLKRAAG
jgi:helix-turn-helix protein